MTGTPRTDQQVKTNSYLIDLPAPVEELPTVAIDDTANTVFCTGMARIFCHTCTFPFRLIIFTRSRKVQQITHKLFP
jgi:hypothetical protein